MTKKKNEKLTVIEQRILDLHKEGWHPINIASIAHVNIGRVKSILHDLNIMN